MQVGEDRPGGDGMLDLFESERWPWRAWFPGRGRHGSLRASWLAGRARLLERRGAFW